MTQAPPPAGWYPQGDQERWWDGNAWSDNFRPLGSPAAQQTYQPTYPQPTYGQPQSYGAQPVQQSHTGRNILIVFGVLFLLLVSGCTAAVVILGDRINDAVNDDHVGGPNNPLTITEGQPFEVDGFEYAAGWTIATDPSDTTLRINDLKVTNNRGKADRLFTRIKLLSGNEVVATIDCDTGGIDKISEGTTITVNCYSSDSLPAAYDKLTIQDAF